MLPNNTAVLMIHSLNPWGAQPSVNKEGALHCIDWQGKPVPWSLFILSFLAEGS
tara:strand:+ start:28816 stop:28977 length:162 start_codon:yes stop_codon:yes gene_type:complete